MTKKIFRSILSVSLIVVFCCTALTIAVLYRYFSQQYSTSLKNNAFYISQGVEKNGVGFLTDLSKQDNTNRITLIESDGKVVFDSEFEAESMSNHADREEFVEALQNGWGESSRFSDTLSEETVNYALKLSDNSVLRVSGTQKSVFSLAVGMIKGVVIVLIGAVLLSFLLAYYVSKATIKPINDIDLDNPQDIIGLDELSPLLRKISIQNNQIKNQMSQLKKSQQEFTVITENMTEGLIIIDSNTNILSYNSSALRAFNLNKIEQNESVFVLNRSKAFMSAVETALSGTHSEGKLKLSGKVYNILVNPVLKGENIVKGAVIVILDVTEKERREQLRKEFSANVSHELKTPLTSISGFAEIIKDGVVKPEDIPHFAENIYKEASRLINLVDDIINISQLDENETDIEKEEFDISSKVNNVVSVLKNKAEKKQVSFIVNTESAVVYGCARIIEEMIYNLCDNAITYNVQGGSVTVSVFNENKSIVLSVKDTGIGIAPEYQERIFERFYRIDKSRSKETGGTGLGLSIVKHAALLHNVQILLTSEINKGTEIKIIFDKPSGY